MSTDFELDYLKSNIWLHVCAPFSKNRNSLVSSRISGAKHNK